LFHESRFRYKADSGQRSINPKKSERSVKQKQTNTARRFDQSDRPVANRLRIAWSAAACLAVVLSAAGTAKSQKPEPGGFDLSPGEPLTVDFSGAGSPGIDSVVPPGGVTPASATVALDDAAAIGNAGETAGPAATADVVRGLMHVESRRGATQPGQLPSPPAKPAAKGAPVLIQAGDMIGFSRELGDGVQAITIINASQRWMAVYHIDTSGQIRLTSSRPLDADFTIQFNATSPLPEEIRRLQGR
jgi:hypothetical protein